MRGYYQVFNTKAYSTTMSDVETAAYNWWFGRRPIYYSEEQHLENPTINTSGLTEIELARSVAMLVERIRLNE